MLGGTGGFMHTVSIPVAVHCMTQSMAAVLVRSSGGSWWRAVHGGGAVFRSRPRERPLRRPLGAPGVLGPRRQALHRHGGPPGRCRDVLPPREVAATQAAPQPPGPPRQCRCLEPPVHHGSIDQGGDPGHRERPDLRDGRG